MVLKSASSALLASLLVVCLASAAAADDAIQYNRDVRPILAENCFRCHGPDSASRQADMRLDRREAAIEAGAFEPGNADDSELVRRIFSDDEEEMMPPPVAKKTLTDAQKDLLKRWIAAGAEYQPHWSLIAPVRPAVPAVKNQAWVKNPIDQFILARLEQQGLEPAPEADRRTLARRLSLDLLGLPPAPAIVEEFVNDQSPDAYERLVDRLLASQHWGEHRGRYWLDMARYADSNGIHFDNYREIWSYRDWVIRAFNRNLPFDQFTLEQLAGDLLPNHSLDQQVASGFNRCNITTNEGGAISEEYLVLYTRDRTETTSQVWLGLTAGCAVCHDHKFDPLTQKEFYSLSAFFNNTTQGAMDGNVKDTAPVVFVPQGDDRERFDVLAREVPEVRQQIESRKQVARAEFDGWVGGVLPEQMAAMIPTDSLRFQAGLSEGSGNTIGVMQDGQPSSVTLASGVAWDAGHVAGQCFKSQPGAVLEIAEAGDFDRDQAFSFGAWVNMLKGGQTGSILARMDDQHDFRGWDLWIEGGRVASHLINRWDQDAIKVVTNASINVGEWNHLFVTYDGSGQAAGLKIYFNGVPQDTTQAANALKSTIRTTVPFTIAQRHSSSRLDDTLIQDLRIYGRALSAVEVDRLAKSTRAAFLIAKPADQRTDAEKSELFGWWLAVLDKPSQDLNARLAALLQEQSILQGRGTVAHIMQEKGETAMAFVLFRGEYDKQRDQVNPATPSFLPPMPDDLPKNRLGFAQWLLRPDQPLVARVTVNRFWQEVFGTGIVRTAGDFGVSGEMPSHPELLDWLAVEFRDSGWDVKKLFKLIVTSSAYRQAALVTPEKLEKDPQNRLLSRGSRYRMDAEMVRDYALASSGLLVEKIGGPSTKPYQPEGVWEAVAMIGSNTRDYVRDNGENLYRRSLYTFWKRAAPPASMDIFNAPSRETCTVRRERTNTPLQALVTLNDPQFIEAARRLAEKTLKEGGDTAESRFDYLARRLLARPLRAEETPLVQASLNELLGYYQAHPDEAKQLLGVGEAKSDPAMDPAALAAWTMLANEMLNLDEVLNK